MLSTSCNKSWTEPEAEVLENQQGLKRFIPLIEVKTVEDLTPATLKYYEEVREYRKKERVIGFGWFGNWTAIGNDPMSYLKMLPDSVDMVSLWGSGTGDLSEAQKLDLKFFQEVKGGKAMICWIVQDTGDQMTPRIAKPDGTLKSGKEHWLDSIGRGDKVKAAEAYADAIADRIMEYGFDGFDIDFEPGYGHHSRWSGIAEEYKPIGPNAGQNQVMHGFIKRLYDRFKEAEAKDGKHRIIAFDGEPDYLTNETAKMVDYFIFQAYWERSTASVLHKISKVNHLDNYQRKTIITVEFEQNWRTGGVEGYRSAKYPELYGKDGAQLFDYATLDFDNGVRIGGIGAYHMEYDKKDTPYKFMRAALHRANKEIPGKFTPTPQN